MVRHDLICTGCEEILYDELVHISLIDSKQLRHSIHAQHHFDIHYASRSHTASVHSSEAAVVWVSEREGKVQYPPRNDIPIPDRLQSRGYVRQELKSLQSLHTHEKKHKVLSERAWMDRGSGRGLEGEGQ